MTGPAVGEGAGAAAADEAPGLAAGAKMTGKAAGAFRTIGELARETGLPQHILRYWETRFPQLRPLQRAGNRRYYRPGDVALVLRIARLLGQDGYTIRGVQKLLAAEGHSAPPADAGAAPDLAAIRRIRDRLAQALDESAASS